MEDEFQKTRIPKFRRFVLQNFPFIEQDFDALTDYALICKVIEYLNKVIESTNATSAQVEVLTNAFNTLKDYVDHYFDTLDVQDEINNKLDQMVEDGVFDDILTSYLYSEIVTTEYFNSDTNTRYWITHIPHLDSKGNIIKLKHGLADDVESTDLSASETPRSFAKRKATTFCINGSIFQNGNTSLSNYMHPLGPIIKDGVLICNYGKEGTFPTTPNYILGIKEDNTFSIYPFETSPEELLADGVYNTIVAFDQLITDGVITTDYSPNYKEMWSIIGQNSETKDIYFFECEGRLFGAEGMSIPTACTILKDLGCDFAYRLDAGGSIGLCKNGIQLNQPIDVYGTEARKTPDYIYFSKDVVTSFDKALHESNNFVSDSTFQDMINKANIYYMQNVDNNKIVFNKGSIVNPNLDGLHLAYTIDGVPNSSIVLSGHNKDKHLAVYDQTNDETIVDIDGLGFTMQVGSDSNDTKNIKLIARDTGNSTVKMGGKSLVFNDHQINLFDNVNDTTKIKIDSDTGKITIGEKIISNFYETINRLENTTDYNTVKTSGLYYVKYLNGTTLNAPSFNKASFLMVSNAGGNLLLQVAFPSTSDTTLKPQYRIDIEGTWTSWSNFS